MKFRDGPLDENIVGSFLDAATTRERQPKIRTVRKVQKHMHRLNPVRWWRFKRDVKWFKGELEKMGIDPEAFGRFL